MSAAIEGLGTAEANWKEWLNSRRWPPIDLTRLAGRRIVVLAAHPDDEVLGVGGLLRQLTADGHVIVAVWATDGESSHPGSTVFSAAELASLRRAESATALARLGVDLADAIHLGLPDSGLRSRAEELNDHLREIVTPHDVVLAPWRYDGHPDHEAVGEAAAALGVPVIEYPIWMWHWASPDDERVPWDRVRMFDGVGVGMKRAAIDAFVSQTEPIGSTAADAAVLPAHVIARFVRPYELVIQ